MHGVHLRMCISLGALREDRSKISASWAAMQIIIIIVVVIIIIIIIIINFFYYLRDDFNCSLINFSDNKLIMMEALSLPAAPQSTQNGLGKKKKTKKKKRRLTKAEKEKACHSHFY